VDEKQMNYRSTAGKAKPAGFREAVFAGLAPDGGLYVPFELPALSGEFLAGLHEQDLHSIGCEVAAAFIPDIPRARLREVIAGAWTFPIPLVHLRENIHLLELFHGPTLAFKDIGARFLARILSHYLHAMRQDITIAVATSGDTGSAVAHGFFNVPHITVYVLYPSGKISRLQEQQMATLGGNVHALEVTGNFDDCQRLVKQALTDREIVETRHLTTANSISLGRLLPQIAYYVWGVAQLMHRTGPSALAARPTVVVPSGNFGNLTAAVYALGMATPIGRLVAATNVNDVGAEYLQTGMFTPRTAIPTCSNAMDVGNPSNLARLQAVFGSDTDALRKQIDAVSVSDEETLAEIRSTFDATGKVVDPHTAVGLVAARRQPATQPIIVAATAHPGKFPDVIERALGRQIPLPPALLDALGKKKQSVPIAADFQELRALLLRG
jgi:threonine synthase